MIKDYKLIGTISSSKAKCDICKQNKPVNQYLSGSDVINICKDCMDGMIEEIFQDYLIMIMDVLRDAKSDLPKQKFKQLFDLIKKQEGDHDRNKKPKN